MTKAIHMMIRVLEEKPAVDFYGTAFGMKVADRFPFENFTLIYLRSPDMDFEVELTVNHDRKEPYAQGDAYGHLAFVTADLDKTHSVFETLGLKPSSIKEFFREGQLLARYFFVEDPDGYKIEVLQRHGRYQ